jgi:hypothetical protein
MQIKPAIKLNPGDTASSRVIDLNTGEPIIPDGQYQWEVAINNGVGCARLTLKDLPIVTE